VGLKNEIMLVIVFLLCFCSEPVAFFILSTFYESIYPRTLYFKEVEDKGLNFKQYVKVIIKILEESAALSQSDAQIIQTYV
jgi:hypothetical protein